MAQIDNFRDVIALWDSLHEMAIEIGAKPSAVSKWRRRDSIPAERVYGHHSPDHQERAANI